MPFQMISPSILKQIFLDHQLVVDLIMLLLQYAGLDERVNAGWPEYKEVLESNNIEHTAYFYEGANHGFHNYSTPRYDKAAADLAWSRTIDFFKKHLS